MACAPINPPVPVVWNPATAVNVVINMDGTLSKVGIPGPTFADGQITASTPILLDPNTCTYITWVMPPLVPPPGFPDSHSPWFQDWFVCLESEDGTIQHGEWFSLFFGLVAITAPVSNFVVDGPVFYSVTQPSYFRIALEEGSLQMQQSITSLWADYTAPGTAWQFTVPTDKLYRLKVYINGDTFDGSLAPNTVPTMELVTTGENNTAAWPLPPLGWDAEGSVHRDTPKGGTNTMRFDAGRGNSWWIVPQLSDSGIELRDKTIKAVRITGKVTDADFKVYGYGATEELDIESMVAGTNSRTGAVVIPDTAGVVSSQRFQVRVPRSALHTVRVEGEWDGENIKDRLDEIEYEIAEQGARR